MGLSFGDTMHTDTLIIILTLIGAIGGLTVLEVRATRRDRNGSTK